MIISGDCLEAMKEIASGSIDAIISDPPYGITKNPWDSVVDLPAMWGEYNRIIKPNGAIILFGQGIFSARLILSNEKMYRYTIIWEKTKAGGFLNARRMPLAAHEDMLVFYKKLPTYNPQMEVGRPYVKTAMSDGDRKNYGNFSRTGTTKVNEGERFPRSVVKIANDNHGSLHPTAKPVELMEWLVKTYTNEDDLVLDSFAGSGSTGVACKNLNRNYILIEKEPEYVAIINKRLG